MLSLDAWASEEQTPPKYRSMHRPAWIGINTDYIDYPHRAMGINAVSQETLDERLEFMANMPITSIADAETQWPIFDGDWWYASVGTPNSTKNAVAAARGATIAAFVADVRSRLPSGARLGMYCPQNFFDYFVNQNDTNWYNVILDKMVRPSLEYLDELHIEIYPHSYDNSITYYKNRITWVLEQYAQLAPDKDLIALYWLRGMVTFAGAFYPAWNHAAIQVARDNCVGCNLWGSNNEEFDDDIRKQVSMWEMEAVRQSLL